MEERNGRWLLKENSISFVLCYQNCLILIYVPMISVKNRELDLGVHFIQQSCR